MIVCPKKTFHSIDTNFSVGKVKNTFYIAKRKWQNQAFFIKKCNYQGIK